MYEGYYSLTHFRKKLNIFRHGDLLFKPIDELPAKSTMKKQKDRILALGEATGHKHVLVGNAQIYNKLDGQGQETKYLELNEDCVVNHQEHNTLKISKGNYVIQMEREYDPFKDIQVRVED